MTLAWIYLLIAAVFEITFALSVKASEGFTKLGPTALMTVAVVGAIYFLGLAVKTLPIGLGYAVWTGLGTLGALAFGVVMLGDKLTPGQVAGVGLVLAGVATLKFLGGEAAA